MVIELNIDRRGKADRLRSTSHHKGAIVTSLAWNSEGSKLFAGDDMGKVSVSNIPVFKVQHTAERVLPRSSVCLVH